MSESTPTPSQTTSERGSGVANMRMHERDTTDILRKRFSHALLLAAGAGAIWYFGVQPLEKTYAAQREAKESVEQKVEMFGSSSNDKQTDDAVKAMNTKFESVTQWTALSSNPSELYESLNSLATKHRVTLERIEPTTQQDVLSTSDNAQASAPRRARRASPTPTTQDKTKWQGRTMSHRMSVTGTFESICDFIGACEHELGATKVRSISIRQSMGIDDSGNRVSAEIETVHFELRKPETPQAKSAGNTSPTDPASLDPAAMSQETPK